MKVFVAGHRGMLGHVVTRFLSENGCLVETSNQRYSALPEDPLVDEICNSDCNWVVNALGKIKQKCQDSSSLFASNTLFPLHLKKRLRDDQWLIHASTDCVFSGRTTGGYSINAVPDPKDDYGLSKMLGEYVSHLDGVYVLRSSVVGPEQNSHAGLMSWFLQQQNQANGFVNHIWNGITTLEWSKVCLEIIRGEHCSQKPICQVGVWPPISKYELLTMIKDLWVHTVNLNSHVADDAVDRSLKPTLFRTSYREQFVELLKWYV